MFRVTFSRQYDNSLTTFFHLFKIRKQKQIKLLDKYDVHFLGSVSRVEKEVLASFSKQILPEKCDTVFR